MWKDILLVRIRMPISQKLKKPRIGENVSIESHVFLLQFIS
mgnify:CR=1 FL=1